MEYLFLLYLNPEETPMSACVQAVRNHWAIMDDATAAGVFRSASPLQPSPGTVIRRSDGGDLSMTDGPFAETKEVLAGYYVLDCADPEEARKWGSRLASTGRIRAVEIRPQAPVPARL